MMPHGVIHGQRPDYRNLSFRSANISQDNDSIRCGCTYVKVVYSLAEARGVPKDFTRNVVLYKRYEKYYQKLTHHWGVSMKLRHEIRRKFAPIVYYDFIRYARDNRLEPGLSFCVPFRVYKDTSTLSNNGIPAEIRSLSKKLSQKRYCMNIGLGSEFPSCFRHKLGVSLAMIPPEEINCGDSLMVVGYHGDKKSIYDDLIIYNMRTRQWSRRHSEYLYGNITRNGVFRQCHLAAFARIAENNEFDFPAENNPINMNFNDSFYVLVLVKEKDGFTPVICEKMSNQRLVPSIVYDGNEILATEDLGNT